ncbi:MAG: SPOR domain-containing protein [Cryomorphaceae bacterium]|nr:SPOR domain-containing protein [Cryomorphaceae bacterium]
MLTTNTLIGELLLRHNCVIVPEFGGFVARQTSAVIDYVSGTMQPPRKSLLFNRQLINNDGLLVAELARTNEISFDEALQMVQGTVAEWNETLIRGERVTIDRVGFIFHDREKNLCFEQDRFFNLLLESYGLGSVHFIAKEDVERVKEGAKIRTLDPAIVEDNGEEVEAEGAEIITHPAASGKRRVWKYVAAAACILPIAFYSIWIPTRTDVIQSGVLSISDFNPFHEKHEAKYAQKSENYDVTISEVEKSLEEQINESPETEVFSVELDDNLTIPVKVERSVEPSTVTPSTQNQSTLGAYDCVVGCFSSQSNAQNMISSLKARGFDARQVDFSNGLYRISAGSVSTEAQARQLVANVNAQGFNGWILRH